MRSLPRFVFATLSVLCLSATVVAANVSVNCNAGGKIQATLNKLDPRGPNTVTVSGNCSENITIFAFDRLSLVAVPGASINDPSGGNLDVIDVFDSSRITIQGFSINGGSAGIACARHSDCQTIGNTIQGSFVGLNAGTSSSVFSANDLIQNNSGNGVNARFDSYFQCDGGTVIQSNLGNGVDVRVNSTIRLIGIKIIGNGNDGVHVAEGSGGRIGFFAGSGVPANIITNNAGNGVFVGDLSFVSFVPENRITGNLSQPDVACHQQLSATRGALTNIGGGTTNCIEPAP